MTVYTTVTGGTRQRAVFDVATYESAPPAARDPDQQLVLHFHIDPTAGDAFLQGAYWALGWSLSTIFGDALGALFEQATLSNIETWNGSEWVSA